ncbi:MAG: glycosyltransferase family 2 protein [Candidatus Sericytochromatia bacterium]
MKNLTDLITFQNLIILTTFWQTFVSFINFISKPILPKEQKKIDELVSILIPARNEEKNIINLLDSIKNQNYENIEVIILDDHSEDNTFDLVQNFCNLNQNFKVIKGETLPPNWLGKNWACHQLALESTGKYLVFLDADTTIYNNLIINSVSYMKDKKLKLLSLFPEQITVTYGEKIVVNFINYVLLTLLPLHLVKIPFFSSISAANGQFMLFERSNYQENLWHKRVRKNIAEDVEIARIMKKNKYKIAVLLGNSFIKCRMYNNIEECIKGFEKNILLIFGNSIIFLILYILLGLLNIFLVNNANNLIIILIFILLSKIFTSITSNQNIILNIILYPFQIIMIIFISLKAVYKKITKNNVSWKNREILLEK